jgi:general secretion pathway protein D
MNNDNVTVYGSNKTAVQVPVNGSLIKWIARVNRGILFILFGIAVFAGLDGVQRVNAQAPIPGHLSPPPPVKAPKASKTDVTIEPGAASNIKPFETGIDYKPTPPGKLITFNLEDADLPDLVRLISQITGRRFIISAKSRAIKATVYAPTKVTAAEAYQAFLSILELNGMSLVPAGRYYKIIESGGIETRPITLQTQSSETVPPGDRYLTRLQRLDNISSDEAVELLSRFKSADGNLTSYAPSNMLIITDTGENINRMIKVLNVVDVARTRERIWIETIRHASATDIAKSLTDIFEPSADKKGAAAPPAKGAAPKKAGGAVGARAGEVHITKILADQRTNSLIILATDAAYMRILDILKKLDSQTESEGRIRVHYLQHSDAEEIANTLSKLTSKLSPKGGKAPAGGEATESFEGQVDVTAQKTANALVITASARDYAALRRTIDELDKERRQVFIEAAIMDMSVNRSSKLGLSYHGGVPNVPTDGAATVIGFNASKSLALGDLNNAGNVDLLSGLAIGVKGKNLDAGVFGASIPAFGVALSATASSGDADVLSTPHLIAMDNVEAEITVGGNVPLQTSAYGGLSSLGSLGGLGGLSGTSAASTALGSLAALGGLGGSYGSVPRQDVGTTVKITPHINESNQIRLEISEEISEASDPSGAGNLGVVSISRTRAKTQVSVSDQQTVVIGGLMRDTVRTGQSKIPILGDLPLLGVLFRQNEKKKEKKNLVLFLTPYIVRSPADLRSIYERKMRERQEFLDRYFVFSGAEYEPPVDYSRTRGLIGEMLLELRAQDEAKKLALEAASRKPENEYLPQPAIGESTGNAAAAGGTAGTDDGDKPGQAAEPSTAPSANAPAPNAAAPVTDEPAAPEPPGAPEPPPAPAGEPIP